MKEEETLCYLLRQLNTLVEKNLTENPKALLEAKRLLNDATYKATRMDIKLWWYKLNSTQYVKFD
jgi:hypothetical protein